MKIGFTGSREGSTPESYAAFANIAVYRMSHATEFHHGCCVGWDEIACTVAGYCIRRNPSFLRIAHLGDMEWLTSDTAKLISEIVLNPKQNLDRNRDIVNACDWLIACPRTHAEELRSGTWSTIRYARKTGRQITIINPDGTLTEEEAVVPW